MVIDVVDVLAVVNCSGADAIDVEIADANIVDNIEVKDKVEVTDPVEVTDEADLGSEEVGDANEVVDDIVEEVNTVVPVVITVTAFAVDSFAIKAVAASMSITADTTRMFKDFRSSNSVLHHIT